MIKDSKNKTHIDINKNTNGENSNKEQIKKLKLWQLQLKTLSTPKPKKVLNNYFNNCKEELSALKMHKVSKKKTVCMDKNESLSKHSDNKFSTRKIKVISLHTKKTQRLIQ